MKYRNYTSIIEFNYNMSHNFTLSFFSLLNERKRPQFTFRQSRRDVPTV